MIEKPTWGQLWKTVPRVFWKVFFTHGCFLLLLQLAPFSRQHHSDWLSLPPWPSIPYDSVFSTDHLIIFSSMLKFRFLSIFPSLESSQTSVHPDTKPTTRPISLGANPESPNFAFYVVFCIWELISKYKKGHMISIILRMSHSWIKSQLTLPTTLPHMWVVNYECTGTLEFLSVQYMIF